MLWSGSSSMPAARDGMWRFLVFAGAAWLAIGWSVLRLEPVDVVDVAGPVILFGAVTEGIRALTGTRMWWLHAGMAALFAVTGVVLWADQDSSLATPAALVGWFLLVRGSVDIAMSSVSREGRRICGLLMALGVLQTALGFFATTRFSRTTDLVIVSLAGLAVTRAVADLMTGLRLQEVGEARATGLTLPPERAAGVAGYSAGLSDYEAAPARGRPRHRASSRSVAAVTAPAEVGGVGSALAGAGQVGAAAAEPVLPGPVGAAAESGDDLGAGPGHGAAAGPQASGATFHDQVLRTTADLDTMLAAAGVTGSGSRAEALPADLPQVPDTAEGAEVPQPAEVAAVAHQGREDDAGVEQPGVSAPAAVDEATSGRAGRPVE